MEVVEESEEGGKTEGMRDRKERRGKRESRGREIEKKV